MTLHMMRIVGIDGGLAGLGVASVDMLDDGSMLVGRLSTYLSKKSDAFSSSQDLEFRLRGLADFLDPFFATADRLVVEALSLPRGASAASKVSAAFGAVIACADCYSLQIHHVAPQAVRKTFGVEPGLGKGGKKDVHARLLNRFPSARGRMPERKDDQAHALDALAVIVAAEETLARALRAGKAGK